MVFYLTCNPRRLDMETKFYIPYLGSLSEVSRSNQSFTPINHYTLGM